MSKSERDPLDQAIDAIARDVPPSRDLWQNIRAEIARTPIVTDAAPVVHRGSSRWLQLAAGFLLVLATSLTTYVVTRQSMQKEAAQIALQQQQLPTPAVTATPASFGADMLSPDYFTARAELDKVFEQRLASLPPATRAKLESSLADLRKATNEISAMLSEHPSDPLLQDLLMSAYQRELQMLADVNDVTASTSMRTDL